MKIIAIALAMLATMVLVDAQTAPTVATGPEAILARNGKRNARVHDPSTLIKCKDEYWVFYTGIGIGSWHSKDLVQWQPGPPVFTEIPTWVTNINMVARQRGNFWAPDVIFQNGRYRLYYSVSSFGVNTSAIALASNPTLDPGDPNYKWTDEGIVIQSVKTNNYNTIDPAVIHAHDDTSWLTFGSFWSGIKLIQLDSPTGKRLLPEVPPIALARHATTNAIEAPYIYWHADYYYLFVNWDRCCRGVNSTYNIRMGRSKEITGPYLDRTGTDLAQGGGTMLLETESPFIGPGHAGILEEQGKYWFSCHFYDGTQRGASMLAIRPLRWDAEGWPVLDADVNVSPK